MDLQRIGSRMEVPQFLLVLVAWGASLVVKSGSVPDFKKKSVVDDGLLDRVRQVTLSSLLLPLPLDWEPCSTYWPIVLLRCLVTLVSVTALGQARIRIPISLAEPDRATPS